MGGKPKEFSGVTYEDHQAASALAKSVLVQVIQRTNPQASITFPEGIENGELGDVYLASKLDLLDFQRKAQRHLGDASQEKLKNDLEHSLVAGILPYAKGPHKGYHKADYVSINDLENSEIKRAIANGYKTFKGEGASKSKGLHASPEERLSPETSAVDRVQKKQQQPTAAAR